MGFIKKWGWVLLLAVIAILFLAYNIVDPGVADQLAKAREAKRNKNAAKIPEDDIEDIQPEPKAEDNVTQ